MSENFKTTISPEGIAELKFDLQGEKVNKLSPLILDELEKKIDELAANKSVQVLKLTSGKNGTFIAGADLHSFAPVFKNPGIARDIIRKGHHVFKKLQDLPFPTIAVIDGTCLGGGLECALACTYRVVTDHPKTLVGLPEVTLGIFPGWGGTQRLPRLIGLSSGLDMILTGKSLNALKAYKSKVADAIIPYEFQEEKLKDFIASILTKKGKNQIADRRKSKKWLPYLLDSNPLGHSIVFSQAEKSVKEKTKGRYPAPLIALKVVKDSYSLPLDEGLKLEADTFIQNIPDGFAVAKDLISLFFVQEALKKETGAPPGTPIKPISSAAIIGAGTMGAAAAWLFASKGLLTRLKDVSWDLVGKGLAVAYATFKKGLKAKKITPSEFDLAFQRISGTVDYSGFEHADLILEAATENLDLKKKIFAELESRVKPDAIIASNTSSLTIAAMAASLKHPERFVAMHFFNPIQKMPLVEVVAGKDTSPETLATAVDFCRKMGKTPIVVGDCPGFLVNRIFLVGANEVMLMLEEGYSLAALNKTILDFGMPMGPFELADAVGIDVTCKVGDIFENAYGDRMHPAKILGMMVERGLLGKKVGKGFQIYSKDKNPVWNRDVSKLLESTGRKKSDLPENMILPRFLYTMINEAARCLEEKIIGRSDYLDMALIMGLGFPPFQGGLLRFADKEGIDKVVNTLKQLTTSQGNRFAPCQLLGTMQKEHKSFY
jgi:3-hydroxyacyl-CoA dehydrogenase / enoyl-CoA hydratase / 3-hydroxybutyryl-CoA epimerase